MVVLSEFIKYHHPSKTYIDNMVKNVVVNIKMAFVRKIINHEKNNKSVKLLHFGKNGQHLSLYPP